MTKTISTPLLSLMSAISESESVRVKFTQNEEAWFDIYGVSQEDRDLIRNSGDLQEIGHKLATEIGQLSLPGKVAVRPDYDSAPVLSLLHNLVENSDIRNRFIKNENVADTSLGYRQLAVTTFGIHHDLQDSFSDLVGNDNESIENAVTNICAAIKLEVMNILKNVS